MTIENPALDANNPAPAEPTGGDPSQTPDPNASPDPGAQGGQVDLSPVIERITDLGSNLDSLMQRVIGPEQEQEPEDPNYPDPPEEMFSGDPAEAMQALTQHILDVVEQNRGIDPALEGRIVAAENFMREQELEALEREFPVLSGEAGEQVADAAEQLAAELSERTGAEVDPYDPSFLRLVYLAGVGEQAATREQRAGQQPGTTLETGAGPNPAPAEKDLADAIVAVSGGQNHGLY